MDEYLKWIYEQTTLSSEFIYKTCDSLEAQANTLLNILLIGAGGAVAYAVNLFTNQTGWLCWGMVGTAGWLFFVAAIVVMKCLWSRDIYGPANDPKHLLAGEKDHCFDSIIRYELEHRQLAISKNRKRNFQISYWLNICRSLAIATPIVFLISAAWVYP